MQHCGVMLNVFGLCRRCPGGKLKLFVNTGVNRSQQNAAGIPAASMTPISRADDDAFIKSVDRSRLFNGSVYGSQETD